MTDVHCQPQRPSCRGPAVTCRVPHSPPLCFLAPPKPSATATGTKHLAQEKTQWHLGLCPVRVALQTHLQAPGSRAPACWPGPPALHLGESGVPLLSWLFCFLACPWFWKAGERVPQVPSGLLLLALHRLLSLLSGLCSACVPTVPSAWGLCRALRLHAQILAHSHLLISHH